MNRSRITGAVLLRLEDCASILSQHLAKLLHRPIRLRSVVEDYAYWCVVLENEYLSISELRPLLCEISATEVIPTGRARSAWSFLAPFCSTPCTQAGVMSISRRTI